MRVGATKELSRPRAVLIAGPTASGKSALALGLARAVNGSLINADALQVYRDLSVLTARPQADELDLVPHSLFGHVGGETRYSVGAWLKAAEGEIAAAQARGRLPILVGGTGLYFRALLTGLAEVPPIAPDVRAAAAALYDDVGAEAFRRRLFELDPEAAERLAPRDRTRLVRAMEVVVGTGKPLVHWIAHGPKPVLSEAETLRLALFPPREVLHGRIEARFDAMIARGALEEVESLLARGYPEAQPIMKAVGVRELGAAIRGEMSLEAAIEAAKAGTRQYAKRQATWIRHQMTSWDILEAQDSGDWAQDLASRLRTSS